MNETTRTLTIDEMDLERHKAAVIETARELTECAQDLRRRLPGAISQAIVWRDAGTDREMPEAEFAAWALTLIDHFHDEPDPHRVLCAPGVLLVDPAMLPDISALNAHKEAFQSACRDMKKTKEKISGHHERLVTRWLRHHGFPRINRRQAYRQIPVFAEGPIERVAFSWCMTRQVYELDREQTRHLIQSQAAERDIETFLDWLDGCEDRHFARVLEPKQPHPRANLLFAGHGPKADRRRQVPAPLPLVINRTLGSPAIKAPPPDRVPSTRHRRPLAKLQPKPFIAALHLYRYRQGH